MDCKREPGLPGSQAHWPILPRARMAACAVQAVNWDAQLRMGSTLENPLGSNSLGQTQTLASALPFLHLSTEGGPQGKTRGPALPTACAEAVRRQGRNQGCRDPRPQLACAMGPSGSMVGCAVVSEVG